MQSSHPPLSAAAAGMRTSVFAALQLRIDAFRANGGDLIPLHIGDTHLAPSAQATSNFGSVDELARYQSVAGLPALREAIAERVSLLDQSVASQWPASQAAAANATATRATATTADQVHVGCGCTHALFCAARALLNPGDQVLVVSPYWPLVTGVLRTVGAEVVEVPLTQELYRDGQFDIAAQLQKALSPRTRALYFITPNNPDGYVYTAEQLEQLAAFARQHDLWVMSDEVYADYAYDRPPLSVAQLPGMAQRTVRSFSLSKSHGLAGARIGYVVAQAAVIDATRRISNHTVYNVPAAMQQVALAALGDNDWPLVAKRHYLQARDACAAALSRHGIAHRSPYGGSFFFLDVTARLAGQPLSQLLEVAIEHGVLLAPGEAFGDAYASALRLCFTGVPLARVVEGVDRLAAALESAG